MTGFEKRLAIVCFSRSLGGLELSTLRLSIGFRNRGIPVLLIAPPSSPLEQRARDEHLPCATLVPHVKYGDVNAAFRLGRLLREHQTDIAILMQSRDIHIAALSATFHKDTKFVFYQQMNSRYNKRDLLHTLSFSRLSLWICLTEQMKKDVLMFTHMPAGKVTVIPLGADLREFDPKRYAKTDARKVMGLPRNRNIIGIVGRLDPLKGQEVFLRAVAEVVPYHSDVFFVIVGDETAQEAGYKAYLENLCRTLEIEQYGKFLPFIRNVPQLLSALDIFVLPSFSETFGLVLIEAMAMKKPVIATAAGGVPEIVTDGKTGLLVEARSSGAISKAIRRILSNKLLRTSLAASARREALKRFDMEACVNALLASLSAL